MPRRRRPPRPGALADLSPLRIFTQIVVLQTAYYACASVLIVFTALVAGKGIDLDLLLSWRSLRGDVTVGWMLGLVWMLNSLISVLLLLLLVARSKLIPDFVLTLHFLHLIITSLYSHSIPAHWFWWALQMSSAGLMAFLGVWSCQWRELRPINFGGGGGPNRSARQGNDGPQSRALLETGYGGEQSGHSAGEYEMAEVDTDKP